MHQNTLMSILVEDWTTAAKSWSISPEINNSSANEVDLNFHWSGRNGRYTSPWSNCHRKLCFKCSANHCIHHWKHVGIVHHIEDSFASLRAFLYLSLQSCSFWSFRRVYRPTFLHCKWIHEAGDYLVSFESCCSVFRLWCVSLHHGSREYGPFSSSSFSYEIL